MMHRSLKPFSFYGVRWNNETKYNKKVFHFNVLVVSWKGKTVTRKALHPRNDCRHWVESRRALQWWPRRDLAKTRTWFSQIIRHSSRDIQLEFSLGHEFDSSQYPTAVVSVFSLPFRSWGKYCLHHIDTFLVRVGIPIFETGTEKPGGDKN